jgi:MFS family permease
MFLLGIFIYGLAAGCYQVFCTMYINETAPMEVRGSAGALTQVSVTFGSLIPFAIAMIWN